jgi:signal transduction histidine kinase
METMYPSPDLAALLENCQDEIQPAWIALLRGLPESRYQETSEEDLESWTAAGLAAITESLREGSKQPLIAHAAKVSQSRRKRGFVINEVVEGLLLMREAAFQPLLTAKGEAKDPAPDPIQRFDTALRILISRLAKIFAEAMNESLSAERDRTAFLLDATGAAGESLDLSVVMPTVAQSIRKALGYSLCSIYLWEETSRGFAPCAIAGGLEDPRLMDVLKDRLDPASNSFAADALLSREISTFRSASGCQFGALSCRELGISVAVVLPIRLADRLLAFALAVDTDPGAEFDSHALVLASAIATSVAPAVDNARRHAQTRRLLSESQKLQRAGESLLEMQGLEDLVTIICREAEKLTSATGTAVFLEEEGAVPPFAFKHAGALSLAEEELQSSCDNDCTRTVLPLAVRGHNLGSLVLMSQEPGFNEDELRFARGFADQAAIAIQHALLHRQHEQLAALRERQRLAHDLHDSVTQSIYGVTMYGEAAARLLEADQPEQASGVLRELRDKALDALGEMRLLIFELRPPILEKEGLAAALEDRLSIVEARAGLITEFEADSDIALPVRIAEALYGIATEALNNVLRHAEASRVSVRLQQQTSTIAMEICDDGRGFEEAEVEQSGGLGLKGMTERATGAGGQLAISSAMGKGTTVRVEVPLETTAEKRGSGEGAI